MTERTSQQGSATTVDSRPGDKTSPGHARSTTATLSKSLPQLALPMAISFTARMLFGQVDLVFAATLGDESWVASIGYYVQFQALFIAVWVGVSGGYTAALSHAFGARDEARVAALKNALLRFLYILVPSLGFLGVGVWYAIPYFGLEPDLEDSFSVYGTTMLIGMSLTGFWAIHPDSVIKAHQDMRSTMIAGLLSTGCNAILNALFVLVFGWGLFGIACATVVSRFPPLWFATWRMNVLERERKSDDSWDQGSSGSYAPPLWAILTLAVPGALSFLLTAAESAVFNNLLGGETAAIAAFGVFNQVQMLALMPAVASAAAVVPFAARLLPLKESVRIGRDLTRTLAFAALFGLLATTLIGWVFGGQIARAVLDAEDDDFAQKVAATQSVLRLLPLSVLATAPFVLLRPVFEAAQRPKIGTMVSIVRFIGLSIPMVTLGSFLADPLGLEPLIAMVGAFIIAAMIASVITAAWVRGVLRP